MHERHESAVWCRLRWVVAAVVLVAVGGIAGPASSQQYPLVTDEGAPGGTALLSRTGLVVTDRTGVAIRYDREPRYDSPDGRYRGFIDRDGGRALRFPADGNGALQVADLRAPQPQFTISSLRATTSPQGVGVAPAPAVVPPLPGAERLHAEPAWGGLATLPAAPADARVPWGRLTTLDARQRGWVLQATAAGPARMAPPAAAVGQYWTVLPVQWGLARLQLFDAGSLWSLSATDPSGPAVLEASSNDPRQLWRVVDDGGSIRLDSAAFPGRSLAGGLDGLVRLERTSGGAAQQWLIDLRLPPAPMVVPTVRLASHRIVANRPLPDVEVMLTNSHHNPIDVVIADLRPGRPGHQLSIPARGVVAVSLSRDAGATVHETYEVRSPDGLLAREELITAIPAATRYDVSVYERFLQSIAIDRTGTSPNVIEDINYQPKSVGIFPLPAGKALVAGTTIDVWAEARAAGNPGGVRPLAADPTAAPPRIDPLQRALEEATR